MKYLEWRLPPPTPPPQATYNTSVADTRLVTRQTPVASQKKDKNEITSFRISYKTLVFLELWHLFVASLVSGGK